MNAFDEKYTIRLAVKSDIDDIMNFIRDNWKEDHILATNKAFFCYEHEFGDKVNFMLAIEKETEEIEGILGFIQASLDEECKDIWGVMWKVRENSLPFLGVELKKRLIKETNCRCEIGVGANPKTAIPILKLILKYKVGKMNHFYQLADKEEYNIAIINNKKIVNIANNEKQNKLIRFDTIDGLINNYDFKKNIDKIPYKDSWYFNKRYFSHPVYKYLVWGINSTRCGIEALLVGREIELKGTKILRIVDFVGNQDALSGLYVEMQELIHKNQYEYIDFYCYGIKKSLLEKSGFILRDEEDNNIIPNYFEPFVQNNIDIWVDSNRENVVMCKADGDQDRPSIIK
jgi:hypothetical protein